MTNWLIIQSGLTTAMKRYCNRKIFQECCLYIIAFFLCYLGREKKEKAGILWSKIIILQMCIRKCYQEIIAAGNSFPVGCQVGCQKPPNYTVTLARVHVSFHRPSLISFHFLGDGDFHLHTPLFFERAAVPARIEQFILLDKMISRNWAIFSLQRELQIVRRWFAC